MVQQQVCTDCEAKPQSKGNHFTATAVELSTLVGNVPTYKVKQQQKNCTFLGQ